MFETSVPEVKGSTIRNEEVPHPFIIEPPLDERLHFGTGDTLDFHLILIGRAVDYIPYFIFGFEELGRLGIGKNKGRYSLENVISIDRDSEILIYDGDSHFKNDCHVLDSGSLVREAAQRMYHQITLRFLTPTRIKNNGKLTIHLDFELMMRNLKSITEAVLACRGALRRNMGTGMEGDAQKGKGGGQDSTDRSEMA